MLSLKANIERSNRKALKQVSVNVTVVDLSLAASRGTAISCPARRRFPALCERIQLISTTGNAARRNISRDHFLNS